MKNKKGKQMAILFLLAITMSFLNFNQFFWNSNNSITDSDSSTDSQLESIELKTSDYSLSHSGTGENMSVTLHQSYVNTSYDIALNASDPNNKTFYITCPTDTTFNSSYSRFDIIDIEAPDKSVNIEDQSKDDYYWLSNQYYHFTSFEVAGNGKLASFHFNISEDTAGTGFLYVYLYNSSWDSDNNRPDHDTQLSTLVNGQFINDIGPGWYEFDITDESLDMGDTENNTYFLAIYDGNGNAKLFYEDSIDSTDDTYCYYRGNILDTDINLKCTFTPASNTPKPSEVSLRINGTNVDDVDSTNEGYWESTVVSSSDTGFLEYIISAEWWNVTCNINKVQNNYTKTDLEATSEFNIAGSGNNVIWNVTKEGGFFNFRSRFSSHQINYTIPNSWDEDTINVFNGPTLKTPDSTNRSLGNGYREVNIRDAGNGTFWYLVAEASNLADNITFFVDSFKTYKVNYTNDIDIVGNFTNIIENGNVTIEIYSPVSTGNYLNHTNYNDSINTAFNYVPVGNWTIKRNATDYGVFITRMSWNNGTAAGFLIGDLTVLGESEVTPFLPNDVFYANQKFNITVYFNDTGQEKPIIGGDISYSIMGSSFTTENVTDTQDGNYTITIDCNDTRFSGYGLKSVEIHANESFYNNQSTTVQFTIYGNTTINYYNFVDDSNYNSSQYFNITVEFYDEIKELGIDGATINYSLNGGVDYRHDNIKPLGNGKYNITVLCNDSYFNDYGPQTIRVNVSKPQYENNTIDFHISIKGDINLIVTKFPDPAKGYYNSDEIFNVTVYFEDLGRNIGIDGGQVKLYIKETSESIYQEYLTTVDPFGIGYYNITIECNDSIFTPYGIYDLKINATKIYYITANYTLENELIIGNTTLTILEPSMPISYVENETFDIMIEYKDHTLSTGITGADINYTIDGTTYRWDKILPNGDGTYNITIDAGDTDFGSNYKNVDIIIGANKSYYVNLTRTFTFERQIATKIEPSNNPPEMQEIRGINITYTFNYTDRNDTPINEYDTFENTTLLNGFQCFLWNNGSGYYTIELNTTNVIVIGTPYTLNFSIYAFGNQSQEISLSILVTIIDTRIDVESWNQNADFARSTDIDLIINFYFNDTTNNQPIENLTNSNIIVRNYASGDIWSPGFELFNRTGAGNYTLNIRTIDTPSGTYNLQLSVSKFPNYDISYAYFQFYLRGNYTSINLLSISDPGGTLTSISPGHHYRIFEGSTTNLVYSILDLEFNNNTVLQAATSYSIGYRNLGTGSTGTLQSTIQFVHPNHVGPINTSIYELTAGNYQITISTVLTNYETASFNFNITIIEKYDVSIDVIDVPLEVTAGNVFNITILAQYYDGTDWLPLIGGNLVVTPYFDSTAGSTIGSAIYTNSSGYYIFQIPTRTDAANVSLVVEIPITYNHLGDTLQTSNIKLNPAPSGLSFEDLLPYLIIIGAAVAAAGGSFAVYRGIIVPKKREKMRILTEVKTIFDDAINLEHVLVLYKGTGTCVYFKSFGSDQIDPELISGFISAISSFGKDLVSQEELNEISYGDKMLLLSDGEFIRVALVLGKNASLILRRNLMEFIHAFEKAYKGDLPNWRGQLNLFRGAGSIIDDILSTSIILPHEITYEHSSVKTLKKPQSREVIKIVNDLMKDSERNFFFIATLLKEATEKTGKDTAEIFMGIKELRDNKILMPIEISTIEKKPISQQEMNLLNQKVGSLVNLSPEERQKLVNDLAQLGPAEREAYFVSLTEQHAIVSAPIESQPEAVSIETIKQAKKEIKNLRKKAIEAKKEKEYEKCLKIYQNAAKIALNWELVKESQEIDDTMRMTKIEDLSIKMKNLEKEAKLAAKKDNFNEAAQKYKISSKLASEIFKLGVDDMTREVKRLTNKAKEFEKLI